MRGTSLAFKDDYYEAPVSSQEVLEANVATIRVDLRELKTDFRAAVARIDQDIKAAVIKLETEIRAMAASAERDLQQFATRIESQLSEMRGEDKALRSRFEGNYETLNAKIDKNHEALNTKVDAANARIVTMDVKIDGLGTRVSVLIWLNGILVAGVIALVTIGKSLNWF